MDLHQTPRWRATSVDVFFFWLLVVGCWLLVVGCGWWLLVVGCGCGCWLLVVGCCGGRRLLLLGGDGGVFMLFFRALVRMTLPNHSKNHLDPSSLAALAPLECWELQGQQSPVRSGIRSKASGCLSGLIPFQQTSTKADSVSK